MMMTMMMVMMMMTMMVMMMMMMMMTMMIMMMIMIMVMVMIMIMMMMVVLMIMMIMMLHLPAGVVFMIGANFILLGSTKVVAILSIYADLSLGLPARLLGRALSAAEDQVRKLHGDWRSPSPLQQR